MPFKSPCPRSRNLQASERRGLEEDLFVGPGAARGGGKREVLASLTILNRSSTNPSQRWLDLQGLLDFAIGDNQDVYRQRCQRCDYYELLLTESKRAQSHGFRVRLTHWGGQYVLLTLLEHSNATLCSTVVIRHKSRI